MPKWICDMNTMDRRKTNDVAELTKLSLKTFINIGQMARYRYLYTYGKELQKDCPALVNACELAQNRDKMIYHSCLVGLGVIGLFVMGISSLTKQR